MLNAIQECKFQNVFAYLFLFSSDHSSSAMLTEESFNLGVFEYLKQVFTGQN